MTRLTKAGGTRSTTAFTAAAQAPVLGLRCGGSDTGEGKGRLCCWNHIMYKRKSLIPTLLGSLKTTIKGKFPFLCF